MPDPRFEILLDAAKREQAADDGGIDLDDDIDIATGPRITARHRAEHRRVSYAHALQVSALRSQRAQHDGERGWGRVGGVRPSAVKVTPKQCPDLHAKLQIACTTLGVDMPDMYIQQNPLVNAFTGGVEKPIIVLHSALIERLNDEETLAVIAHEVGHIHAEHVLYLTAAKLMEALANLSVARLIPGSEIVKFIISAGIASALLAWARRAELSCDRAALLVVQDPHVVGRTMMKLAGGTFASKIDYDEFLEQGREFQKNYDEKKLDKFWADIINAGLSHPFPIWRVSEIIKWVESGEYDEVMKKN